MSTLNVTKTGTSIKGEIRSQSNESNLQVLVKNTNKLFSYSGSKEKFTPQFKEVLEKNGIIEVDTYIEAFAGSLASLLINLQFIKAKKVVINDFNERLINLYIWTQKDGNLIYEGFKMIEDEFQSFIPKNSPRVKAYPKDRRDEVKECVEFYKYIRTCMNKDELGDFKAAATLWTLHHNFNGIYREDKKGNFNNSFNWSTKKLNVEKIRKNIENLNKIFNSTETEFVFETLDVDLLISKYNNRDTFIYLDPAYIDTKIQYNHERDGQENSFINVDTHIKLLDNCSKYKYVMFSNNDHEDFQKYFKKNFVTFNRGNVSQKKSNKSKKEILGFIENTPVNNKDYKNESKENSYSIKIGTAFSGMGCPEYSLKQLGVNHTSEFAIEWDKFAQETLRKNYNPKQLYGDISTVDTKELNTCDLYVWGSPCQDLSMANLNRKGLNGEKSKLFFEGLRILKDLNPKYTIWENVGGATISNNGEDIKTIKKAFEDLGTHNLYMKKVNPVDIGGNTTRTRLFIVMIRKDIDIEFNFPINKQSTSCIKDCLLEGDYNYLNKEGFIPWEKEVCNQRGKLRKTHRYTKVSRQDRQRVYDINYKCPTILTDGKVLINDGIGFRYLSPEELKRVQGFGDDLDMSHLSNTQIKKQLGNTMEVETMKQLLGEIIRIDKVQKSINEQEVKKTA